MAAAEQLMRGQLAVPTVASLDEMLQVYLTVPLPLADIRGHGSC